MNDSFDDELLVSFSKSCSTCGVDYNITSYGIMCESCGTIAPYSIEEFMDLMEYETPAKKYNLTIEQCKALKNEFANLNKRAFDENRKSIDNETIEFAMDLFSDIRPFIAETRNKRRQQYIAACILKAGRVLKITRTKKEVLIFCGLVDRNITKPLNMIDSLILQKHLSADKYEVDVKDSFITGMFHKLNILEDDREAVKQDALYVLTIMEDILLISSNFDSKLITVIYIALRLNGYAISLKYICSITCLHIETINSIIDRIKKNNNLFIRFNERFNTNNTEKIKIYKQYKEECMNITTFNKTPSF